MIFFAVIVVFFFILLMFVAIGTMYFSFYLNQSLLSIEYYISNIQYGVPVLMTYFYNIHVIVIIQRKLRRTSVKH